MPSENLIKQIYKKQRCDIPIIELLLSNNPKDKNVRPYGETEYKGDKTK